MNLRLPALFLYLFIFKFSYVNAQWDDKDRLTPVFHQERREAFRALMPEKSVAIFFSNPIRNRSNDVDYQYSQDPNFYYLTGYLEPNSLLIILKNPLSIDGKEANELIFVQNRNTKKEVWTGDRLGVEGVQQRLGFKAVFNGNDFNEFGLDFTKFGNILVKYPEGISNSKNEEPDLGDLVDQLKEKLNSLSDRVDNYLGQRIMKELREIKHPEEIAIMQKAIDITNYGFLRLMKEIQPNMMEYQAQAIVEYEMKKNGSEYPGYCSIAGSGKNGCVLHYTFNRKKMTDGELLLADIGAEYHNYTADITRTIPVNGKFSENQKIIYQLVLNAQNAGIELCRARNPFRSTHDTAVKVITEGLLKLGIIKSENEYFKYFMHGTSHYLGLDVHDAGTNGKLKSGTIITVEPGIYIPKGADCDPKWWDIGIRIEDDVLITDTNPIILSGSLPREIEDIERLMAK